MWKMNHLTHLFIQKKITQYMEVSDQLAHPLTLYTWTSIGLATPCVVVNSIGAPL